MTFRTLRATLAGCLICTTVLAQSAEPYQVPRTEYGQPDFQGVWSTVFNTMLERPGGMPLILSPEQAAGFAAIVSENQPDNNDPDVDRFGPPTLAKVNGEFRSSVVVYPESGVLPYNELGTQMSSYNYFKGSSGFDHPEERPGVERCIEAWGSPPMRAFMYQLFHGFVQTKDTIAIISEEAVALRVIHMNGYIRPDVIRSMEGHSIGHWEGDTLVVETTHYSDVNPARATVSRPMLISSAARVTERFTRTSETELNYQYTVNDPTYYNESWKGEFSFTRDASGHIYEYSCHEGNYSMVGALRGARAQEAQAAQKKPL